MMLVSLADAKNHLRVDGDDDDQDIQFKLEQASAIVLDYIKKPDAYQDSSGEVPTDSSGKPLDVPFHIAAATMLVLGNLYMNREGGTGSEFRAPDPISQAVISLLARSRDPALA